MSLIFNAFQFTMQEFLGCDSIAKPDPAGQR